MTKNEITILKNELKQLPLLDKELKMWLSLLRSKAYDNALQSPNWSGVKTNCKTDKTADLALSVTQNKEQITNLIFRIEKQKNKLLRFIYSIDDSLNRQILYYRHIEGLEWNEVANKVGGYNSDTGVKKAYARIFEKSYNFRILTEETLLQ